jgi:ABC-type transport system substrate-binding protein
MALNFLMNLFYFTIAFLAVLLIYEGRNLDPGKIPKDNGKFFWRVILAVVIITVSGGIIDAYLVYQSGVTVRLVFDLTRWVAATVLIFAIACLSSAYVIGTSPRLSIFPASILALINPVSWWLNAVLTGSYFLSMTLVGALFLVPFVLMGLGAWHGRYSGKVDIMENEKEPDVSKVRAKTRRKGVTLVGLSILIAVITFLSAISLALTAQWYDENRSHHGPTTFYVGLSEAVMTANPIIGISDSDLVFESYVYDRLTTLGYNMSIGPDLAESWWHMDGQTAASLGSDFAGLTYSNPANWSDGSIWEFNLTRNVYWSDGRLFTADDVIFTLSSVVMDRHSYYIVQKFYDQTKWIEHFEKQGDYKVRIFFSNHSSYGPTPVAWGDCLRIPILPKHVFGNESWAYVLQNWTGIPAIGTGPFTYTYVDELLMNAESVTLVKNPYYDFVNETGARLGLGGHYNRTVEIDKLVMKFYAEEQTLIVDLKTQKLDTAKIIPVNYLAMKENKPLGLTLVSLFSSTTDSKISHFNVWSGASASLNPTRLDPALLRATAVAMNKSYICDAIYKGFATPGVGILSPVWSQYYWTPPHNVTSTFDVTDGSGNVIWNYTLPLDEVMSFNLTLANKILDEAGYLWTNGVWSVTNTNTLRKVGPDAADRLVNLGIIDNASVAVNKTLEFEDVYEIDVFEDADISQYLSAEWAHIGVKLTQKPVNAGVWYQLIYGFQYLFTESHRNGDGDLNYLMGIVASDGMNGWNEFGTMNATYDHYYDMQASSLNFDERKQWIDKCQEWQYLAGGAMMVTCYPKTCYAYNDASNGSGQWTGWMNISLYPESAFDSMWPENPLFSHLKWLGYMTAYDDSSLLVVWALGVGFGGVVAVAIGALLYFRRDPDSLDK